MRVDSTTVLLLLTLTLGGMLGVAVTTTTAFVTTPRIGTPSFVTTSSKSTSTSTSTSSRYTSTQRLQVLYDDFEDFSFLPSNSNSNSNSGDGNENEDENEDENKDPNQAGSGSDDLLYSALRARQEALGSTGGSKDDESSSSMRHQSSPYSRDNQVEDNGNDSNNDSNSDKKNQEAACLSNNWKDASCVSTIRLTLDDWIRRIAIDTYPLAVCGSASGTLYLADLQAGEELDRKVHVHVGRHDLDDDDLDHDPQPAMLDDAIHDLFGQFDGGGIIGLAMKDDWVVSSGREGGVHVCQIVGEEQDVYKGSRGGTQKQTKLNLQRLGRMRSIRSDVIITSIVFEDGAGTTLWMGGYDGVLRGFDFEEESPGDDDMPLMLRQEKATFEVNFGSPIVHLSINDETGCGVASTVSKGIILFSLEDGEILGKWNPLVKKVRKEFVRSAILLKDTSGSEHTWSVVCGGSRGSMFRRPLNVDRTGFVSEARPFLDQTNHAEAAIPIKMRPNHLGAVVDLASPAPGILVSGALDGSMRVWDCSVFGNAKTMNRDREQDVDVDVDIDEDDEGEEDDDELEAQYDDVQQNESRPQCLYALSGYKVWLGSIFANSRKLVSDGADNTIIVHSFEDEEEVLFTEEDEEDDNEGFSFE